MSKINDGGFIHPFEWSKEIEGIPGAKLGLCRQEANGGMTLRQWYAGMAMQGILTCKGRYGVTDMDNVICSFRYADAMIKHEEDERHDKNNNS